MLNLHFERKYHFVILNKPIFVCFLSFYVVVFDRLLRREHLCMRSLSKAYTYYYIERTTQRGRKCEIDGKNGYIFNCLFKRFVMNINKV